MFCVLPSVCVFPSECDNTMYHLLSLCISKHTFSSSFPTVMELKYIHCQGYEEYTAAVFFFHHFGVYEVFPSEVTSHLN